MSISADAGNIQLKRVIKILLKILIKTADRLTNKDMQTIESKLMKVKRILRRPKEEIK